MKINKDRIKGYESPENVNDYEDGDIFVISNSLFVVYTSKDDGAKLIHCIPFEVIDVLEVEETPKTEGSSGYMDDLIKLSGKYSADDIIKFKNNGMI